MRCYHHNHLLLIRTSTTKNAAPTLALPRTSLPKFLGIVGSTWEVCSIRGPSQEAPQKERAGWFRSKAKEMPLCQRLLKKLTGPQYPPAECRYWITSWNTRKHRKSRRTQARCVRVRYPVPFSYFRGSFCAPPRTRMTRDWRTSQLREQPPMKLL